MAVHQPFPNSRPNRRAFFVNPVRAAGFVVIACLTACGPAEPEPQHPAPAKTSAVQSATPAKSSAEGTASPKESPAEDEAVAALGKAFLSEYLRLDPVHATELGDHARDGEWTDKSLEGEAEFKRFVNKTLEDANKIQAGRLSLNARVDLEMLKDRLAYWLFSLEELRPAETDPLMYTGLLSDGLDPLVTRNFAPLPERMASLGKRLMGIGKVVAAAKARLKNPPELHTQTAIQQNQGLIALCEKNLAPHLAKLTDAALKKEVETSAKHAVVQLKDLQTFLEKELLPKSRGDFRLGQKRFEKKMRFYMSDPALDIQALRRAAGELIEQTQGEMVATAKELWPMLMGAQSMPPAGSPEQKKALVKKVIEKLAEDHPDNKTIVAEASKQLASATEFVRKNDLVEIPNEKVSVIEMPEYRRGVAVAYCDASGFLEKVQETFYAISPTPSDWKPNRVASFYREYNRSMLADLTVHEAMPGHFLQLMHGHRFSSPIRAALRSGPFVEGWATYAEWVMAKYGFGGPQVRMMQQKMVLRLAANAILDYETHAGAMDEKAALALMMNEAFQEEGEAVGKWKRARLGSAQLSTYFYGYTQMRALRGQFDQKSGFNERKYHDAVLSFGAPDMRHLYELMKAWGN